MDNWMQIISWLVGILGLGTGGVLYYGSRKRTEAAHSKEAVVKAHLAEVEAYTTRIKNLSEELKQVSDETKIVRQELLETRQELQDTKDDLIAAKALIRQMQLNKAEIDQLLNNYKNENAELKRQNSILRMQTGNLKKRNDKATTTKIVKSATKKKPC